VRTQADVSVLLSDEPFIQSDEPLVFVSNGTTARNLVIVQHRVWWSLLCTGSVSHSRDDVCSATVLRQADVAVVLADVTIVLADVAVVLADVAFVLADVAVVLANIAE